MNQPEIERLVRVEVIMDEVRDDLKSLIRKIDSLETRVRSTEDAIQATKVGWRVLLTIGTGVVTISGFIGAMIAKFLPFLSSFPK